MILALLVAGMLAAMANGVIEPCLAPHMISSFQYDERAVGNAFGVMGGIYVLTSPLIG
jgi:hypothetical protein